VFDIYSDALWRYLSNP